LLASNSKGSVASISDTLFGKYEEETGEEETEEEKDNPNGIQSRPQCDLQMYLVEKQNWYVVLRARIFNGNPRGSHGFQQERRNYQHLTTPPFTPHISLSLSLSLVHTSLSVCVLPALLLVVIVVVEEAGG